jgi:hypothetical protein
MFRTLIFSIWFLLHPVHVTLNSINYVPEVDSFNVLVTINNFEEGVKLTSDMTG